MRYPLTIDSAYGFHQVINMTVVYFTDHKLAYDDVSKDEKLDRYSTSLVRGDSLAKI